MDLDALRSFYHVARERSFSRAARNLHISQPAMSVRIKQLETELDEKLFDRQRRGVALTEAGAVLLESAERIFADVEEARVRLRELKQAGGGHVRVGCSDTVSLYLLPPVLGKFRRRFPLAEIMIRNAYSTDILDLLVRGELDFGIVTRPPGLDRRLEAREILVEPYVLAGRKGDPLLRRAQVPLSALEGQAMVALEPGTVTRDAVDRVLRAAKVRPRIVLETGNVEVQKLYAMSGFGCAILPQSAVADADRRRMEIRPLKGAPLKRTVAVVVSRDRYLSRASQALLGLVGDAI